MLGPDTAGSWTCLQDGERPFRMQLVVGLRSRKASPSCFMRQRTRAPGNACSKTARGQFHKPAPMTTRSSVSMLTGLMFQLLGCDCCELRNGFGSMFRCGHGLQNGNGAIETRDVSVTRSSTVGWHTLGKKRYGAQRIIRWEKLAYPFDVHTQHVRYAPAFVPRQQEDSPEKNDVNILAWVGDITQTGGWKAKPTRIPSQCSGHSSRPPGPRTVAADLCSIARIFLSLYLI